MGGKDDGDDGEGTGGGREGLAEGNFSVRYLSCRPFDWITH